MRIPATLCTSVSIGALAGALGGVPPLVSLNGFQVATTTCRASKGRRPLFRCPRCSRGVVLLYFPDSEQSGACRQCMGVSYPSRFLRGTSLEVFTGVRPWTA